jgi:hypothetical protein
MPPQNPVNLPISILETQMEQTYAKAKDNMADEFAKTWTVNSLTIRSIT